MAHSKGQDSRDAKGRFLQGGPPGPGRPPAAKEREYLDRFRSAVPLEKWAEATEAILRKACKGDVRCWLALARFVLPQPAAMVEVYREEEARYEFRVAGKSDSELAAEMAEEVRRSLEAMGVLGDDGDS